MKHIKLILISLVCVIATMTKAQEAEIFEGEYQSDCLHQKAAL